MSDLLKKLTRKQQRGSKPRCHWITHGSPREVACRLTQLIAPWGDVSETERWMPQGFNQIEEAELHKAESLLPQKDCAAIKDWWFKVAHGRQTGPSFDIGSTCTVTVKGSRHKGLLLLEAKAYDKELQNEEIGKRAPSAGSENSRINHEHICKAIADTNQCYEATTGIKWSLSCDARYQMSNRFASACELSKLGYSVILVYLGFINANEMKDKGKPIASAEYWKRLVEEHSKPLFPSCVWGQPQKVHAQWIVPLIRSTMIGYNHPIEEFVVR